MLAQLDSVSSFGPFRQVHEVATNATKEAYARADLTLLETTRSSMR